MSKQFPSDSDTNMHYFVVYGIQTGDNTIEFSVDNDSAIARFPEGLCYDGLSENWKVPSTRNELHNEEVMSRLLKAALEEKTFLRPAL